MAYTPPLNGGRINATIAGNTTGVGSLVSTGTMTLAGGNNITLSQNANAITISAANQSVQTVGMYATGNSTGNSSTTLDARSVSFNGLGGMSVGYSNSSVQLSAPVVSSVSATGIINISSNGAIVSIGAPAFTAGMSTIGHTSGISGTVSNQLILSGGNNITLSQSTGIGGNTLGISAANQSVQTQGIQSINIGGNTTGTTANISSGAMNLAGGFNITVSQNANNLTLMGPPETWLPSDNNLIAAAFDPASCDDNGSSPISGTVYMIAVNVRYATTISYLHAVIGVAGSGLTNNQCYLGLYSSSGTLLAQTANQSTSWTTAGNVKAALTSSYNAAAGTYYVAILANGTTRPYFACGSALGANFTPGNANLTAATARFGRGPASRTSLPSSITMSSLVMDSNSYWAAVS